MNRKRKWLLLSLALFCGLALTLTMFSSGQEANQLPNDQKMPQFLKQLSDLYKTMGVQKLSQATNEQKKMASQDFLDALYGEPGLPADNRNPKRTMSKNRLDLLIDPQLQKRWGNPSFDVGRGTIMASSNPKSLESPYLKIRRAWQKNGIWRAFCEFALFKAEEIATESIITRLNLAPTPELNNDLGSASTGAPRLRVGTPGHWDTDKGFTGQGVIVGDVDTGIDWTHGDFINPDGTTRILYLWDTSVDTAGRDPETLYGITGFNYGTVYTKAEIDGGTCTELDTNSHGTHTCGTAAGNGGATGNYTGMAPNADIIFVKGLDMWGIEFIFEMASRLGRPVAVNNSYGYPWTSYLNATYASYLPYFAGDGSDYESQYIDYLTYYYPQGAIVVKSAGNEGMWQTYKDHDDYGFALYKGSLHCEGIARIGTARLHTYKRVPHPEYYGIRSEYSDFWIRSNKPVKVTIKTGVKTYTCQTGQSGNFNDAYSAHTGYNMNGGDPYNGEYCGYFLFDEWNADPGWGEGNWTINVKALIPGDIVKYDVWLKSNLIHWVNAGHTTAYNSYDSCFSTNSSYGEYILDWGASENIITVGAWTTRSSYLALDGYTYYPWGFMEPKLNTITYFSSPGPSRDGRMKPDIAAPGAVIMSACPYNLTYYTEDLDPDQKHQWMWGTSMAAPHATGGVALMLQKFPHSTLPQVRFFLKNTAQKDIWTRAIGPNGFGAGKLNVRRLKSVPVAVLTVDKNVLVLSKNQTATLNGERSYDPDELPIKLKWVLVSSPIGAAGQLIPNWNYKTATLIPDPNKPGIYSIGLIAEGTLGDSPMVTVKIQAVK